MCRAFSILFPVLFVHVVNAQTSVPSLLNDSIKILKVKPANSRSKSLSVYDQVKISLQIILDKYRTATNEEITWKRIRKEADSLLLTFFNSGKLTGTRPEKAYYMQIGLQTMTAKDISAGKKILIAGIATVKPSEFVLIRTETK
jgi:hypothetical protein